MALISDSLAAKILGGILFLALAYIGWDKLNGDDDEVSGTAPAAVEQPVSDEL